MTQGSKPTACNYSPGDSQAGTHRPLGLMTHHKLILFAWALTDMDRLNQNEATGYARGWMQQLTGASANPPRRPRPCSLGDP